MKNLITLLLLSLTAIGFAQQTVIEGTTLDAENNPLPYANIGIANTAIGTVSNSEGNFTLKLPGGYNPNNNVVFSYVGYAPQEHSVASLLEKQNRIMLQPEPKAIEEVVVTLKTPKPRKIGRAATGLGLMHQNFYTASESDVDDRLSKEMGMKLHINRDCRVNNLNFNITSNEFESVIFRINFYRIEDGLPTELLVEDNIICEVKNGQLGWFSVNLKPYNIHLSKELKEVAVTIQWLESKKSNQDSKYFALSSAMAPLSTSYYREKGLDKWNAGSSSLSFYLDVMSN